MRTAGRDANVGAPISHEVADHARIGAHQLHAELSLLVPELTEHLAHKRLDGRMARGQSRGSAGPLDRGDDLIDRVRLLEQLARLLIQPPAGGRQLHPVRRALQQFHSHERLQVVQALRKGRL